MMRFALLFFMCLSACAVQASDMRFSLDERDFRPKLDLYQWIYADGDIVPGTSERFMSFVKSNPQLLRNATVVLNSLGGSPIEGMRLGDAIRDLHFRTDIGTAGPTPMSRQPGQCMSACIYPYLGGEYRYLDTGSVIGIHRFRFEKDFGGALASEVSQQVSGEIVSYLKRARADPSLFALMVQTAPEKIRILSADELRDFKIVTGDVLSEEWSFEVRGTISYLKADQKTWRGENKLIFACLTSNRGREVNMMTLSELPQREAVIAEAKTPVLFIDDNTSVLQPGSFTNDPKLEGDSYISWSIALSPGQIDALKQAKRIGSGISAAPGIFAGVLGINVGDGREKLTRLLNDCNDATRSSTPNSLPSKTTSVPAFPNTIAPAQNATPEELGLAKKVASNFNKQYKSMGMAGIKSSVEACYSVAAQRRKISAVEYCFLLDQLASSVDATVTRSLNVSQDDFWKEQNATRRSTTALELLQVDRNAGGRLIAAWQRAKTSALVELGNLR